MAMVVAVTPGPSAAGLPTAADPPPVVPPNCASRGCADPACGPVPSVDPDAVPCVVPPVPEPAGAPAGSPSPGCAPASPSEPASAWARDAAGTVVPHAAAASRAAQQPAAGTSRTLL